MQFTKVQIESLLWEEESTTLDFKSEQYPFSGATDTQKSELVKDVLAFANAFARTDAFILIGVKDAKGGRSEVIGVTAQLDDASIQQLVHGCIKQNLVFSYKAMELDGKPIGVIHIPRQIRPFYPKKDFGKLKKSEVYFRRGSSTAVATPEEIAAMGADKSPPAGAEPALEISIYEHGSDTLLGTKATLKHLVLDVPPSKEIADYHEATEPFHRMSRSINNNYYRHLASYTHIVNAFRSITFAVTNTGDATAQGVRLQIEVSKSNNSVYFLTEHEIPDVPVQSRSLIMPHFELSKNVSPLALHIKQSPQKWQIEYDVGKVQPKAVEILPDDLFVCAYESGQLVLTMKFFADNLRQPIEAECRLEHVVERRRVTMDEIEDMEMTRFANSPERRRLQEDNE